MSGPELLPSTPAEAAPEGLVTCTVYAPETGEVICIAVIPRRLMAAAYPGCAIIIGAALDHDRQYVDPATGEARDRPPPPSVQADKGAIAATGDDVVTLTGIPAHAEVFVDGRSVAADDDGAGGQFLRVASLHPGRLRLAVKAWPSRDWRGEIDCI